MNEWKFLIICMLFAMWIIFSFMTSLYQIEVSGYNERMEAFYDDVFQYMTYKNISDVQFNYTPFQPEKDLSHAEGLF